MVRELIRLEDVHRSFGPVTVLEGVNVRIDEGDRIGIVGHNGAGKTTLLRTVSQQDQDVGEISFAPGLRIAFLTQVRDINDGATLEEELGRKGRQFEEIDEELSMIEAKMADPSFYEGDWQADIDRYQELQSMNAKSGGSNVASHAQEILRALDLSQHPMETPLESLSGGERAKVALARQLVGLSGIDVIFLDEPTNHLDIQTTEWLEAFLKDFKGAQLIVSHDRYFLDQVCNRVVEIDNLRAWPWKGNYSQFIVQKVASEQALNERIGNLEKKIQSTTGAIQQMKRANKYDKSISAKHKMITRMQQELKALKARVPKKRKPLILKLDAIDKASMDVLELVDATKTFEGLERPILDNQTLEVRKGDRIGIVGGNGQGKTTLLKIINEELKLDSGKIDVSPGTVIGYFHQDHATLDFELNPVEQIQKLRPDYQYGDIRAALGRFQFSSDQVGTKLKQLSGGERARVALLKLLLEDNNLLLMDEPTNHLDMESKETLEEALIGYEGSLITVSHDRWFLDQVVNRIWEIEGGNIKVYYGNYTDYVRAKQGLPPLADDEISQV